MARSTKTCSSTACPTRSKPTWRITMSGAPKTPTLTTPPAGRWPATRPSSAGSATSSTAALPIRSLLAGRRASPPAVRCAAHFTHAIDLMPTVLEVLGIEPPLMMKGVPQEEIAGASLTSTFADAQGGRSAPDTIFRMLRLARNLPPGLESSDLPPDSGHSGRWSG